MKLIIKILKYTLLSIILLITGCCLLLIIGIHLIIYLITDAEFNKPFNKIPDELLKQSQIKLPSDYKILYHFHPSRYEGIHERWIIASINPFQFPPQNEVNLLCIYPRKNTTPYIPHVLFDNSDIKDNQYLICEKDLIYVNIYTWDFEKQNILDTQIQVEKMFIRAEHIKTKQYNYLEFSYNNKIEFYDFQKIKNYEIEKE